MIKNRTNFIKLFGVLIIALFMFVGCNEETPEVVDEITQEMLAALEFNDVTLDYDGKPHSIFIDNIYEDKGVEITYTNNEKIIPGNYTITAKIKYKEIKVTKTAALIIEKGDSVLTAETVQTINLSNSKPVINYSLDNKSQQITIVDENGKEIKASSLIVPGVYNLELYAKESSYYNESNHVKVTVNVIESQFEINFESKKVIADGTEKKVELEGTIPSEYTVEYTNNVGTTDGNYYAVAEIKNSAGEVIETHRAVLVIENPENEEFKKYLEDFFVEYLEGDQLSVNIFCEDPTKFGLEHYEAEWYTFESFTDEDLAHDLQMFQELLAELEKFEDAELNDLQESAYETIRKFLEYYINYYSIEDALFMEITYVDQFGGYVADFSTYMEAYSLRSEVEVQDIVSYIESTKEAFPSYLLFLQAKVDAGYPLSDYTINEMRGYLEDVLREGEKYYLVDILNEKIDGLDFLDDAAKASYKDKIATGIKDYFIVGVQSLYDGLEDFLGILPAEDEGYLSKYENGEELFVLDLKNLLGYEDLDLDAYIAELDAELTKAVRQVISAQQSLIYNFKINTYAEIEEIVQGTAVIEGTPEEMMVYLKEFAKSIVPELESNPEIVIKNMDLASAKVSNAVAYYMKSALDNTKAEYITLNPIKLGTESPSEVLATLAHEGYPGHLYAYVYSKELELSDVATIMTSTAHAEGWATYVQLKLYEYAKANTTDKDVQVVMDYLYANQISGFLLESRLDAGIHLQGWGVQDIANYMSGVGYSADSAGDIYNLLVEIPTQYVSYGYGKLVFNNLHNEAKKVLGAYYNEVEFNAMLLSKGWTDLDLLEETYENYMMIKCHEYGIEFNK